MYKVCLLVCVFLLNGCFMVKSECDEIPNDLIFESPINAWFEIACLDDGHIFKAKEGWSLIDSDKYNKAITPLVNFDSIKSIKEEGLNSKFIEIQHKKLTYVHKDNVNNYLSEELGHDVNYLDIYLYRLGSEEGFFIDTYIYVDEVPEYIRVCKRYCLDGLPAAFFQVKKI